jgi:hypothetical protein
MGQLAVTPEAKDKRLDSSEDPEQDPYQELWVPPQRRPKKLDKLGSRHDPSEKSPKSSYCFDPAHHQRIPRHQSAGRPLRKPEPGRIRPLRTTWLLALGTRRISKIESCCMYAKPLDVNQGKVLVIKMLYLKGIEEAGMPSMHMKIRPHGHGHGHG